MHVAVQVWNNVEIEKQKTSSPKYIAHVIEWKGDHQVAIMYVV